MYYIVGKDSIPGTLTNDNNWEGTVGGYWEMGWEINATNLIIKHEKLIGNIKDDDILVTAIDRMFLYKVQFKNVISYSEFLSRNITNENVTDICEILLNQMGYSAIDTLIKNRNISKRYEFPKVVNGRYEYFNDKNFLTQFEKADISRFNTNNPFYVLHIRYRKFNENRNYPEDFYNKLIEKLKGYSGYIFGKEAKKFERKDVDVNHVGLNEYATLMNHPNCKYFFGAMSGATMLSQHFCHLNTKVFVFINDASKLYGNGTGWTEHDGAFNFTGSETKFVKTENIFNILSLN